MAMHALAVPAGMAIPDVVAGAGLTSGTPAGAAPASRVMAGAGLAPRAMAGAGWPPTTLLAAGKGLTRGPALSTAAEPGAASASSPNLAKAAQNFEALTIAQLLRPMFDTVDTAHGPFGGGDAEAAWKPMLVDAIARQVAARGGFGFAQPVFHALLRAQERQSGKPAS